MIDLIIQQINTTDLGSMTGIFTRMGGIVRTQKETVVNEVKTYPVVRDTGSIVCQGGDYIDFVPNSNEIGMLWWETISSSPANEKNKGVFQHSDRVRLIAWVNQQRLDPESMETLAGNVKKSIEFKQADLTFLKGIYVKYENYELRS